MNSMPPYENSNPYAPPTQYPASGYMPPSGPYQSPYQTPVYYVQPQYVVMPIDDPGSGQALAGMILSIVGLFFPFFGVVPLLGLIFSIIGLRSITRKGMAIAGLIISLLDILFAVFITLLIFGALFSISHASTY